MNSQHAREPTAPEVQTGVRECNPGWTAQPIRGQMPYQQAAVTATTPETRPEDQTPEPVQSMGVGGWLDDQAQKALDWWNQRPPTEMPTDVGQTPGTQAQLAQTMPAA